MQRTRAILYVCAGVFALTGGARPATAEFLWLYDYVNTTTDTYTMGIYSPRFNPIGPSAMLHGTIPPPGAVGEVAMAQAVIRAGQQIPLPVFSDGTAATEDEVFWTAHLWLAHFGMVNITEPHYRGEDRAAVAFSGLTCSSASVVINNTTGEVPVHATDVEIMVTVVAVRQQGPTPTNGQGWGGLKSRYRGERGAAGSVR